MSLILIFCKKLISWNPPDFMEFAWFRSERPLARNGNPYVLTLFIITLREMGSSLWLFMIHTSQKMVVQFERTSRYDWVPKNCIVKWKEHYLSWETTEKFFYEKYRYYRKQMTHMLSMNPYIFPVMDFSWKIFHYLSSFCLDKRRAMSNLMINKDIVIDNMAVPPWN